MLAANLPFVNSCVNMKNIDHPEKTVRTKAISTFSVSEGRVFGVFFGFCLFVF